jgi:hypothetical protein
MVTEAGASVTFCTNPEAPTTESISMDIKSSMLMSNRFGVAGLSWASARGELSRGRIESVIRISARGSDAQAEEPDGFVLRQSALRVVSTDGVKNVRVAIIKSSPPPLTDRPHFLRCHSKSIRQSWRKVFTAIRFSPRAN